MLNGDGNESGIKINRSNQQKNKLHVQYTFFSNQEKKTNLHVQHAFCLSLPLFCATTMLFCRAKTSNFLVTHYFYGGIVVCAYLIFCLLCSSSLLFFTAAHFHLPGRQHFSLGPFMRGKIRRVLHKTKACRRFISNIKESGFLSHLLPQPTNVIVVIFSNFVTHSYNRI